MQHSETGTIRRIGDIETKGTFSSRRIWLDIEPGQYAQTIEFQVSQGKIDLFRGINQGDEVTIHFNLRGKVSPYQGRDSVFNNLSAWKVEVVRAAATQQAYTQPAQSANGGGYSNQYAQAHNAGVNSPDDDQLPF